MSLVKPTGTAECTGARRRRSISANQRRGESRRDVGSPNDRNTYAVSHAVSHADDLMVVKLFITRPEQAKAAVAAAVEDLAASMSASTTRPYSTHSYNRMACDQRCFRNVDAQATACSRDKPNLAHELIY